MKIKIISAAIILASLFACKKGVIAVPVATFNEPQPANIESLPTFPKRLQGQYLSLKDSSILSINDKFIRRTLDFDNKIHTKELDSMRQNNMCQIRGDTLIFLDDTHEKMKIIKQVGDSLLLRERFIDTLFQIGRNNILRKFKGFYFLNTRYDKDSWGVEKARLAKGVLVISSTTKADIKKLEEITGTETEAETETPQDTDTVAVVVPKFTTTKKQFKTFIKNEGFSNSETFVKQR